jgi:hypothetical protein
MKKILFYSSLIIFLSFGFFVQAETVGENIAFNVQSEYDLKNRTELTAVYIERTSLLNFYIETDFWSSLEYQEQKNTKNSLIDLAEEFEENIYPTLTETFGSEWNPGIDNNKKITILFHEMASGVSGYFNSGDEYKVIQVSDSNEREMLYLDPSYIGDEKIKSFLAHEFVHLITFNQKEKKHNVSEEVWLNEARSEYSTKLLGYEDFETGNILKKRVETFISNPNDPLCEWGKEEKDYGVINVFAHYLTDHYGIEILVDSLKSNKVGVESINYALEKNGFEEDFGDVFTNWAIAVLINDCNVSDYYCYKDENLKSLRVTPSLNLIPLNGESSLVVSDSVKNWTGKWYKFAGGKGDLEIMFNGSSNNIYEVPYVIKDVSGEIDVKFFELESNQGGRISIPDFGEEIISVTLIPLLQTKTSNFNEDPALPFIIEASTIPESSISVNFEKPISEMDKGEVQEKIGIIESILNMLKERLNSFFSKDKFETNLYYGVRGEEIRRLQQFLSDQGEEIYPEKLVTGNFLSLTRQAVVRFQEKYKDEILTPLGLEKGTGYFGPSTRQKVNELLGY